MIFEILNERVFETLEPQFFTDKIFGSYCQNNAYTQHCWKRRARLDNALTRVCLYSIMVEAPQLREMFPAYYIFNGLLSVLLVLHVVWTYFILKIAYIALTQGKVQTY